MTRLGPEGRWDFVEVLGAFERLRGSRVAVQVQAAASGRVELVMIGVVGEVAMVTEEAGGVEHGAAFVPLAGGFDRSALFGEPGLYLHGEEFAHGAELSRGYSFGIAMRDGRSFSVQVEVFIEEKGAGS